MDFGSAVAAIKMGKKVYREAWEGKGMWWIALQVPDAHSKMSLPYIYMKNEFGDLFPWAATHADIIAEDWVFY